MRQYDIFKDGVNVRVFDKFVNKYGIVKDIKETAYEWIDPFVLFDGETDLKIGKNLYVVEPGDENS